MKRVLIAVMVMAFASAPQAQDQNARLEAQKATYPDVVRVCVMEPRCEAVTFWGVTDAHSWIRGDSPLLFDAQYAAKPAYFGVLDAFSGR